MWIADKWKDYEVIDCSGGEKLERWGDYTLVRPDPQVIWDTPNKEKGWKHRNGHYHRRLFCCGGSARSSFSSPGVFLACLRSPGDRGAPEDTLPSALTSHPLRCR